MANGEYLSLEELKKLSEPLERVRGDIKGLADAEGLDFAYNVRGWPNILIRWQSSKGLNCTIQLYMNTDKATYNLWIAVSKDLEVGRYSFTKHINEALIPPFDVEIMIKSIKSGLYTCNSIKFEDLTLLTDA